MHLMTQKIGTQTLDNRLKIHISFPTYIIIVTKGHWEHYSKEMQHHCCLMWHKVSRFSKQLPGLLAEQYYAGNTSYVVRWWCAVVRIFTHCLPGQRNDTKYLFSTSVQCKGSPVLLSENQYIIYVGRKIMASVNYCWVSCGELCGALLVPAFVLKTDCQKVISDVLMCFLCFNTIALFVSRLWSVGFMKGFYM